MNGYLLPVECPRCGGELDAVLSSKVNARTACSAISKCSECSYEWQVSVTLRPVPKPLSVRKQQYRERTKT